MCEDENNSTLLAFAGSAVLIFAQRRGAGESRGSLLEVGAPEQGSTKTCYKYRCTQSGTCDDLPDNSREGTTCDIYTKQDEIMSLVFVVGVALCCAAFILRRVCCKPTDGETLTDDAEGQAPTDDEDSLRSVKV